MSLGKFFGFLVVAGISAFVALWPEAAAYGIWHAVAPVTELGRIALALGLLFFGGGLSILFGILGLTLFTTGVTTLISGRKW